MEFTCRQIVIALIVSALVYILYSKMCDDVPMLVKPEMYEDGTSQEVHKEEKVKEEEVDEETEQGVMPYSGDSDALELANMNDAKIELGSCGKSDQFVSSNLLPKADPQMDESSEFAPQLEGKNFVDSYKYVFGSQSQSLRNANYQLRSDPVNPQENICPWMQSTIHPEVRRQLDISSS